MSKAHKTTTLPKSISWVFFAIILTALVGIALYIRINSNSSKQVDYSEARDYIERSYFDNYEISQNFLQRINHYPDSLPAYLTRQGFSFYEDGSSVYDICKNGTCATFSINDSKHYTPFVSVVTETEICGRPFSNRVLGTAVKSVDVSNKIILDTNNLSTSVANVTLYGPNNTCEEVSLETLKPGHTFTRFWDQNGTLFAVKLRTI